MTYTAKQRFEQARALRDPDLLFGQWVDYHSSLEDAIFRLLDGSSQKYDWQWPENLTPDIRSLIVTIHTICSYQSGGWAVGVIDNGLHVLPFVPDALTKLGYLSQADSALRSILLFPKDFDFSGPSNSLQTDAINAIESWPDYNGFLTEIEDHLGPDWEWNDGQLPEKVLRFAKTLNQTPVWENKAESR